MSTMLESSDAVSTVPDWALEKYRYCNVKDHYWCEYLLENWAEELENKYGWWTNYSANYFGIFYSVSNSQGDGVMVEGRVENWKLFLNALNAEGYITLPDTLIELVHAGEYYELELDVRHYGHYYNSSNSQITYNLTCYLDTQSEFLESVFNVYTKALEALEAGITAWYHAKCREFYRQLQTEYNYAISDEAVAETVLANNYLDLEEAS